MAKPVVDAVLDRARLTSRLKSGPGPALPMPDAPQEPPPLQVASNSGKGRKRGPKPKAERSPENDLFAPGMPTNGIDLMALWELPTQAFQGGRIKITRRKYASLELELIDESDIASYQMQNVAKSFGQGDYYIQLSAASNGLWKARSVKMSVSAEYAAACGWQAYPVQAAQPATLPRISEARALQATAGALDGSKPITVGDLASLVEMVADKTAQAITRNTAPPAPPMGFESMMALWTAMMQMQKDSDDRSMKFAALVSGGKLPKPDDEETEPPSLMESIAKSLPDLIRIFVPQNQPLQQRNEPTQPVQPNPSAEPQRGAAGPAQPSPEEPAMQLDPNIPLNEEEQRMFAGAAFMLRPFVPVILQAMSSGKTMAEVGYELADYIPYKLEGQMVELARLCKERGPNVLGIISRDLCKDEAAEVVAAIAEIITAEEPSGAGTPATFVTTAAAEAVQDPTGRTPGNKPGG